MKGGVPGERIRPALLFSMRPTAEPAVRTGSTRAIFPSSPGPANLGRRTTPEVARLPLGAEPPVRCTTTPGPERTERCGTRTTPETQGCRCGCSGCSCCGRPSARCPDHCSRTRRAPPGLMSTGDPTGPSAGPMSMTYGRRHTKRSAELRGQRARLSQCEAGKIARTRRCAPLVPLAGTAVVSAQGWGTRTTPETQG